MPNSCCGSSLKNSVQNSFSLLNRADDESDYVAELFLIKKKKKGHLTLAIQAIFENEMILYHLSKTACLII